MKRERPKLQMPACLANIKEVRPKRESAARAEARRLLNAKLEEAAKEIEALKRSVPNWGPALSSAAEKVRSKKIGVNEL